MHGACEILFLSDWHVSAGIGDGSGADSMLARDGEGLPFIPGRAVKGALREGARRISLCRSDLARAETMLWGSRSLGATSNESGLLRVSCATLPDAVRCALPADPVLRAGLVKDLAVVRSQTSLTEEGVAKSHTLRSIECGMAGMSLQFTIDCQEPEGVGVEWLRAYFHAVCVAVRGIGGHRSRGLGRCRIAMAGVSGPVHLPPVCQPLAAKEVN